MVRIYGGASGGSDIERLRSEGGSLTRALSDREEKEVG